MTKKQPMMAVVRKKEQSLHNLRVLLPTTSITHVANTLMNKSKGDRFRQKTNIGRKQEPDILDTPATSYWLRHWCSRFGPCASLFVDKPEHSKISPNLQITKQPSHHHAFSHVLPVKPARIHFRRIWQHHFVHFRRSSVHLGRHSEHLWGSLWTPPRRPIDSVWGDSRHHHVSIRSGQRIGGLPARQHCRSRRLGSSCGWLSGVCARWQGQEDAQEFLDSATNDGNDMRTPD